MEKKYFYQLCLDKDFKCGFEEALEFKGIDKFVDMFGDDIVYFPGACYDKMVNLFDLYGEKLRELVEGNNGVINVADVNEILKLEVYLHYLVEEFTFDEYDYSCFNPDRIIEDPDKMICDEMLGAYFDYDKFDEYKLLK